MISNLRFLYVVASEAKQSPVLRGIVHLHLAQALVLSLRSSQ